MTKTITPEQHARLVALTEKAWALERYAIAHALRCMKIKVQHG